MPMLWPRTRPWQCHTRDDFALAVLAKARCCADNEYRGCRPDQTGELEIAWRAPLQASTSTRSLATPMPFLCRRAMRMLRTPSDATAPLRPTLRHRHYSVPGHSSVCALSRIVVCHTTSACHQPCCTNYGTYKHKMQLANDHTHPGHRSQTGFLKAGNVMADAARTSSPFCALSRFARVKTTMHACQSVCLSRLAIYQPKRCLACRRKSLEYG